MIYKTSGQVNHITDPEVYCKEGKQKVIIVLTEPNSLVQNRVEYIPYDLLDENMSLLDELDICVGDHIEIDFEQRGRKWNGKNGITFFHNNEIITISK